MPRSLLTNAMTSPARSPARRRGETDALLLLMGKGLGQRQAPGFFLLLLILLLSACGDKAGQQAGVDQHGQPVVASRLQGKWLVINYWAIWCAPCRREIPELNQLAQQLAGDTEVFAVNFDGKQGQVLAEEAAELGIAFTVLAQDPAARFNLPRSAALPVTYLIDPAGKLQKTLLGEQTATGIREQLKSLKRD